MAGRDILVFYSEADPFEEWAAALAQALPDLDVRRHDAIDDPADVRYALVWKPPVGFFARFPNLALVINLGAGTDALIARDDLPTVPITRLSDPAMAQMMAGFVLFAVLRHARDIPAFEAGQRAREWRYVHPRAAATIRVGVLGLGELGGHAASELARQGFEVHGWSRTPKAIPGVACCSGGDALLPMLGKVEILVVMLPSTPRTRGLIGERELAALPRGAVLVNVARGDIVDEPALIAALQDGHLGGATLDVFATEPLPADSPLWTMENVLVTPHVASAAIPATAAAQIAENIRRVRAGDRDIRHVADPARGY
ncbi:2-hydroxyacid dehydrogenase [Marinivivus vitaminiproducens]|uniref:2-hydroxyacid dehydrogenase n=1 Tax=Marinivivus vitaminiproducens TaxID=3035935 RepID=UPI0027993412|nr:glyoxylate/hydroxypyruvate reductase A [Geminicoccaceae bacterium SCSIO 64248]